MTDNRRSSDALLAPRTGKPPGQLLTYCRHGWAELVDGLRSWRIWHLIGSAEIRRRYARSRLGQAWLVLSTAVTVTSLGWLWGTLWRLPVQEMLLYVGISLVLWQFFSGTVVDCSNAFVANAHYFMNQHVSPSTIVLAIIYRHVLILGHNALIVVVLLAFIGIWPGWALLYLIPGAAFVLILSYWFGYVLAALSARYRDISQVAAIVIQFGFFFTPIIWKLDQAPAEARRFLLLNPFHHLIEVIRAPLVGSAPDGWTWASVAVLSLGGFVLSLPLIGWVRNRIVFWL